MSRALTRNITRKQALSYDRTKPNKLGVRALVEVNGRRAYRQRYEQTKRILRGERTGAALRPNRAGRTGAPKLEEAMAYTSGQRRAMVKMSPARRKAFQAMLHKAPPIEALRARRNKAKPNLRQSGRKKTATRRPRAARPVVVTPAAPRARAAKAARPAKKDFLMARMEAGRTYGQAMQDWSLRYGKARRASKSAKHRKPRHYGRYAPLTARVGSRTRRTYLYRTRSGKTRHIPEYAILGYPSARAMAMEPQSKPGAARYVARSERLTARRARAAEAEAKRIRAGRGVFSPNDPGVLSWEEWRSMNQNRKRKRTRRGRKLTKAERAVISRRNLKKARKAQKRGGGRRHYEDNARRRRRPRRRYAENLRRRGRGRKLTKAERRVISLRNLAKARRAKRHGTAVRHRAKRGGWARLKGRKGRRMTFPTSGARFGALTLYPNGRVAFTDNRRRRRSRRRYEDNPVRYDENRRRRRGYRRYEDNRRRRRTGRRYRRNAAGNWLGGLQEALKIGGIVVVGFVAHRALTRVLSDQVFGKIEAFQTGALSTWRDQIAAFIVAAAAVPLAVKFVPMESAAAAAGVAASFLHGLIIKALGEAGQGQVAAYLSAYPDASAPAYPGVGSYYTFRRGQQMSGMGEYYGLGPGPLTYGELRQPAAGFGQPGAMVTQEAAGEYLVYGAEGLGGDYEQVGMQRIPTSIDEGVMPTLEAAEHALNVMEAAAGVGAAEIPMQSAVYPQDQVSPISDEPGGSRSGVFSGGGGIFGG